MSSNITPLSDISTEFKGIDISELIAAPLIAASESQSKLATHTANFIKTVGTKEDGSVNNVQFSYHTKKEDNTEVTNVIDVPLLSIVNIPNLAIKKAEVAFTIEVKSQSKHSTSRDIQGEAGGNVGWGPLGVKIGGSISTKSEYTRATDKSAKYDIRIEARDDGMPEGLARVLDFMTNNIGNPALKPNQPASSGSAGSS
jgi:hypothetical protein